MTVAQKLQTELASARHTLLAFAREVRAMRDAQSRRECCGRVATTCEMCRRERSVDDRLDEILGPAPGTLAGLCGGPRQ